MNLYYVNYLLKKGNDIFEQIDLLKKNIDNEEVQLYVDNLKNEENLSPNLKQIIDKFLFNKETSDEIKYNGELLYPLSIKHHNTSVKIERIISPGDEIVIMRGLYAGCNGQLLSINNKNAKVLLNIFDLENLVDISIDDIGGKIYESKNN